MPTRPPLHRPQGQRTRRDSRREYDRARQGSTIRSLYDYRWRIYSQDRLRRYPLCAEHEREGRIVAATLTDHIEPHRGDYETFWDPGNHQSLCDHCHNSKKQREENVMRVTKKM